MSRRAFDVDVVLEDLRRELRIAPSSHFENRVRAYVAAGASSRSPLAPRALRVTTRQSLILIGLTMSVVAAGLVLLVGQSSVGNADFASSSIPAASVTHIRAMPVPVADPGAALYAAATGQSPAVAAAPVRSTGWDDEVIVPPDQLDVLSRLLETMHQQRMAWTPGPPVPGIAEPLPEPQPIEIPLIKIEPLPALGPAPGERKQPWDRF